MSKKHNKTVSLDKWAPIGLLAIAAATVVPLVSGPAAQDAPWYRYLFGAGAVWILVCRLFSRYNDSDDRLRRLRRIESWSAIFFCAATFFLFWPGATMRDWLAFTLAGAAIQIYTSLAIPARQKKIASGNK